MINGNIFYLSMLNYDIVKESKMWFWYNSGKEIINGERKVILVKKV